MANGAATPFSAVTSLGQPQPTTPQAATALAVQAAQAGFYQAALDTMDVIVGPGIPPSDAFPVILDWVDASPTGQPGLLGVDQLLAERGRPVPFSWWQQLPQGRPQPAMQAVPMWLQSRPYNRGAGAFSPKFGQLTSNPIGAGVYAPYRLPTIAGPGATYTFGAIWFDAQVIPTSIQINPTIPIETMDALIATSSVAGTYLTTG